MTQMKLTLYATGRDNKSVTWKMRAVGGLHIEPNEFKEFANVILAVASAKRVAKRFNIALSNDLVKDIPQWSSNQAHYINGGAEL